MRPLRYSLIFLLATAGLTAHAATEPTAQAEASPWAALTASAVALIGVMFGYFRGWFADEGKKKEALPAETVRQISEVHSAIHGNPQDERPGIAIRVKRIAKKLEAEDE